MLLLAGEQGIELTAHLERVAIHLGLDGTRPKSLGHSMPRFSPEVKAAALERYFGTKVPVKTIAADVGCSSDTLVGWARRTGRWLRASDYLVGWRVPPDVRDELLRLLLAGLSPAQIERDLSIRNVNHSPGAGVEYWAFISAGRQSNLTGEQLGWPWSVERIDTARIRLEDGDAPEHVAVDLAVSPHMLMVWFWGQRAKDPQWQNLAVEQVMAADRALEDIAVRSNISVERLMSYVAVVGGIPLEHWALAGNDGWDHVPEPWHPALVLHAHHWRFRD